MNYIYLDYNATTPLDESVIESMLPYLYGKFENPSSSHVFGIEAKNAVEKARMQVAELLGCAENEIIFTSGGSESNNMALKGIASMHKVKGDHIITSSIEHPAITQVCDYLKQQGFKITTLPVDGNARINPNDVQKAITPQTILISIMHANNEVGTIEPIKEISAIAHSHDILLHTDAAQSIGKIPVRVDDLGVDLLSLAGHKLYAPKGVGALYVRSGTVLEKMIHGAGHERNMRAGTENVMGIVGLGKACELIQHNLAEYSSRYLNTRDHLEKIILSEYPWVIINGDIEHRLPNTSNLSFKGIEAYRILAELNLVAASAGAACHSNRIEISDVLKAMHVPDQIAMGSIRFSTGRSTMLRDIDNAGQEIIRVIKKIKFEGNDL